MFLVYCEKMRLYENPNFPQWFSKGRWYFFLTHPVCTTQEKWLLINSKIKHKNEKQVGSHHIWQYLITVLNMIYKITSSSLNRGSNDIVISMHYSFPSKESDILEQHFYPSSAHSRPLTTLYQGLLSFIFETTTHTINYFLFLFQIGNYKLQILICNL